MISVNKDFKNIPDSLNSKITIKNRNEIISKNKYDKRFDNQYKKNDVKENLNTIYNEKCVFCENNQEILQVEHYRPKSVYYWLAFSWDNLLLACHKCNISKSDKFEIEDENKRIKFDLSELAEIHNLIEKYNKTENPSLLNPELQEDVKHFENFVFNEKGEISFKNNDIRCKYTIELCKLNRKYLKTQRYAIIDNLEKDLKYAKILTNPKESIELIIKRFIEESKNPKNDFLGFRQYVAKYLLSDIIFTNIQ